MEINENYSNKKRTNNFKENIKLIIVTLIIALLFFILNVYTPLFADDFSYSYSFSTGKKITSFSQIISSQISHYYTMNGRSITHTIAQIFLLLGDTKFNLINTFFFVVLIYLICFHAFGDIHKINAYNISLIAMLLFLTVPAFGQSFLWITGASNYLYGILIVLFALIPYRIHIKKGNKSSNIFISVLLSGFMLFLGILAGWTNENTSVALIAMIILYLISYCIKSIKIRLWNITGLIGSVIGCVIMLISPGTSSRLSGAGGSGNIIAWIKRFVFYSANAVIYLDILIILIIIFIFLYFLSQKKSFKFLKSKELFIDFIKEYDIYIIYMIGFLASVYSMIVSPQFPDRAWSGPSVLLIIFTISLSSLFNHKMQLIRLPKLVIICFIFALTSSHYINAYFELKNINIEYQNRIELINNAKSKHKLEVEVPTIKSKSGYSSYDYLGDLNDSSNKWPNTAIARYFGVKRIIKK